MARTTFPPLTPPNGKLRVGLVGAGDISFYHLSAWRKLATVELAAICDLDGARPAPRGRIRPDMPGETLATIMLETPQGAPVTLAGSFVALGFGATVSDRLEIIGSKASIILDGDRQAIRDAHAEEHRFDNKLGYQACFDEAIAHFVSALIAGAAFETEGEDNLQTLRLVEDFYGLAAPNRAH